MLVLPIDMVVFDASIPDFLYLTIPRAKTSFRGGARSQYTRVSLPHIVCFIASHYGPFGRDEALWWGSAATFRKRFDFALLQIGVPRSKYTPGGLRGGGAVWKFQRDGSIPDLMWSMRVSSQQTLGHYLQETAAAMSISALGDACLHKIRVLSKISKPLLEAASVASKLDCRVPLARFL
jgi:hypothetical protein